MNDGGCITYFLQFDSSTGSRRDQEEGGGAGPSREPMRDQEQGGGAGPSREPMRDQEQGGGAGPSREPMRDQEQGGGAGPSGEIKSREVELDPQERSRAGRWSWTLRRAQERSRAGRWSWTLRRDQEQGGGAGPSGEIKSREVELDPQERS